MTITTIYIMFSFFPLYTLRIFEDIIHLLMPRNTAHSAIVASTCMWKMKADPVHA